MNDHELITAVREAVADVHATTRVEQIRKRGRTVRARRRIPGLAAVVVAGVAATALLTASHPASHRPGAELMAWTVAKRPGGTVSVTIRELDDPAGLQRTLRADGVPAVVSFYAQSRPSSCRPYAAGRGLLGKIFPTPLAPTAAVVIRPSALPAGVGVYLNDSSNPYGFIGVSLGLVHTSKQCTGS